MSYELVVFVFLCVPLCLLRAALCNYFLLHRVPQRDHGGSQSEL